MDNVSKLTTLSLCQYNLDKLNLVMIKICKYIFFAYLAGWMIGQQHDWQATLDETRLGTFFSHQPITTKASEVNQ